MQITTKEILWNQFGASIDMLENALLMCPVESRDTKNKFWYNAFHCLFFLDYYLKLSRKKCHDLILGLPDGIANQSWTNYSRNMNYSVLELLVYNLRHGQHHAAQPVSYTHLRAHETD